jgi:AmmeMemoRadiSam system protein B
MAPPPPFGANSAAARDIANVLHPYTDLMLGRLDAVVLDHVARVDADGLQQALDVQPEHACGGGPTVAGMRAARQLGARDAVVLRYADSGDISGDKSQVVGYMAAVLGTFAR